MTNKNISKSIQPNSKSEMTNWPKVKSKKHHAEEDILVPSPIKVKIEKKKKRNSKNRSNMEETSSDSEQQETMVPTPIRIKYEKTKTQHDSKNVPVPHPMNIKIETTQRKNNTDSEGSSFEDHEVLVPAPTKVKKENKKRKQNSDGEGSPKKKLKLTNGSKPQITKEDHNMSQDSSDTDNSQNSSNQKKGKGKSQSKTKRESLSEKPNELSESDESEDGVPLPIIIKEEPQSRSSSSESEFKTEENETPESIKVRMEYLNASKETPKKKTWIEQIQSRYPNIVKHKISLGIPDTNKYFILRVPKTIDPSKLAGLPWDLDRNLKFNLPNNKEKYVIHTLKNNPDPCFVIGNEAKVLEVEKIYTITKHISKKRHPSWELPGETNVPLPDNIKTRHPLFGVDYKNQIKLRKDVKHRLKDAVENLRKQNLKEIKKKKKTKKIKQEVEETSELIFNILKN